MSISDQYKAFLYNKPQHKPVPKERLSLGSHCTPLGIESNCAPSSQYRPLNYPKVCLMAAQIHFSSKNSGILYFYQSIFLSFASFSTRLLNFSYAKVIRQPEQITSLWIFTQNMNFKCRSICIICSLPHLYAYESGKGTPQCLKHQIIRVPHKRHLAHLELENVYQRCLEWEGEKGISQTKKVKLMVIILTCTLGIRMRIWKHGPCLKW